MGCSRRGLCRFLLQSAKNKNIRLCETSPERDGLSRGEILRLQCDVLQGQDGAFVVTVHFYLFKWIHKMPFHMHTSLSRSVLFIYLSQFFFLSSRSCHISTKQSTFGMMWNVLIGAWMHHYGVSMDPNLPEERLQHLVESMLPWNGKRSSDSTSLNTLYIMLNIHFVV